MAFELERCGGMNTCGTTPLPAWIPFTLSQSAALSERLRRKGLHEGERKESIPETSPQLSGGGGGSGVRGQPLRRYVRC